MTGQLVAVDGGFTLANGFPNRELFLNEDCADAAEVTEGRLAGARLDGGARC